MTSENALASSVARRALVLGGNGFIGSNVVDRLLLEGWSIRVFDRGPSKFRAELPGVEYVYGEFGNVGLLQEALDKVDVVFHLISTSLPKTSNDDPIYDVRSNLVDTLQFLGLATRAGVSKVVFASSGGTVYGLPQADPIDERHPTDPICSYGITKLAIEKYLELFHHLYGLEYAVLRISNPFGPYQSFRAIQGAIAVFMGKALREEKIEIWGDGSVVRDYLFAEDLAAAFVRAADPFEGPRVLNVGSGRGTSLREIVEGIAAVSGRDLKVDYTAARAFDVPRNVLSIERAQLVLGWQPKTTFEEGLRRTWHWMLANQEQMGGLSVRIPGQSQGASNVVTP